MYKHFIVFFIAFDEDLHDKLSREDPMDHFLYVWDPKVSGRLITSISIVVVRL